MYSMLEQTYLCGSLILNGTNYVVPEIHDSLQIFLFVISWTATQTCLLYLPRLILCVFSLADHHEFTNLPLYSLDFLTQGRVSELGLSNLFHLLVRKIDLLGFDVYDQDTIRDQVKCVLDSFLQLKDIVSLKTRNILPTVPSLECS